MMFTGIYTTIAKVAAYALAVCLVVGGCWYGVDSVVGAFRDRTTLTASLATAEHQRVQVTAEREAARKEANEATARAQAMQLVADRVQREAHDRDVLNAKTLSEAQAKLAYWKAHANDATRTCLDLVVPDGL